MRSFDAFATFSSSLHLPSAFRRAIAAVCLYGTLFAAPPRLVSQVQPAVGAVHSADPWWHHAVVYEIYPRSFQDTTGDGIGDLSGITQRLPYLHHLGVDAIWISPMYPSPQVDFGYDISDYEAVDPQYGTMADMDRLIKEANQNNIKVLLDMVMNHTSDKHKWFIEAASSRTNPKHDWYVWNDGKAINAPGVTDYQKKYEHEGRVPPNNWVSLFGGSAWEWVPAVRQFYYHKFYKQQPDLNWRNPEVEKAMFGVLRFWLDRGVSGFRLDAIPTLFEDPQLRDERDLGGVNAQGDPNLNDEYTNMLPEVHDVQRRMRKVIDSYPGDRVLIGETYLPNTRELLKWYGTDAHEELQLPMDTLVGFHSEGGGPSSPNVALNLAHFRETLTDMQTVLGDNWPLLVFDNHDNPRSWDRFGDGAHNPEIAKLISTVLLTTRATALMYYGEEIGMKTSTPQRKEDVKDPIGITGWPKEKGRDGERTPMQWDGSSQAGFSTNPHTWLPVASDYKTVNVASEEKDPHSQFNWFRQLIELRRTNPALHNGKEFMLDNKNANVLSFARVSGSDAVVVALNFSSQPQTISLDVSPAGIQGSSVQTILTDAPDLSATTSLKNITLPPFTSWIASVR